MVKPITKAPARGSCCHETSVRVWSYSPQSEPTPSPGKETGVQEDILKKCFANPSFSSRKVFMSQGNLSSKLGLNAKNEGNEK